MENTVTIKYSNNGANASLSAVGTGGHCIFEIKCFLFCQMFNLYKYIYVNAQSYFKYFLSVIALKLRHQLITSPITLDDVNWPTFDITVDNFSVTAADATLIDFDIVSAMLESTFITL